jgi:hypothetical protein
MKKIIVLILMILSTQNALAQNGMIISKGVIYCKKEAVFALPDSIFILNDDESINAKLLKQNDTIDIQYEIPPTDLIINQNLKKIYPFYYDENSKYNAPIPNIIIRAYYPDYGVLVIDANKISNEEYEVFVNGEWKKVKSNNNLTYKDWGDFIKDLLVKVPDNINLYSQNDVKSKKIKTSKNLSYKVIEVKENWIKIECNESCDDCKGKKKKSGWVEWKNGNKLLISLFYVY